MSQTEKASNLKSDGYYCPMCDTVWALPDKCRCDPVNTEPTKYPDNFRKLYMNSVEMSKEDKQLYDMAWNAAIEAAAKCADNNGSTIFEAEKIAANIRSLKK